MNGALVYVLIFLGSALMVYNIIGFILYAKNIQKKNKWGKEKRILYIPIVLLIMFLMGYLFVGFFGQPDLIMAGILFGGSIFVFIMYHLLNGITKRIMSNEHMEAQLRAAELSSKTKESLLATISHEMRTPMNVILGLDRLALKNPDLPEETRTQLENIGVSAEYLLALINSMLDLNHIGTGELKLVHERFYMKRLLDQVAVLTQNGCKEKNLTWETDFSCPEDGYYKGDETRLKQVLLSILDNAVKYTDAPGTVKFSSSLVRQEDGISTFNFIIEDTGVGIDQDFLPSIFDTFTQEDMTSTRSVAGSGLGLAVAKNLTQLMDGTISVESEKGKGSVFTVVIPFEEDGPGAVIEEEDDSSEVTLEGKKILIVEDVELNAEIVSDLLELENAVSEHAENGQIAVDMVSASPEYYYDAILMDLRMPVMDGYEATRTIRSLDRADVKIIPIIALTANAFEENIHEALESGMNTHLAKPADAEMLYDTIKKQISMAESKRRRQEN